MSAITDFHTPVRVVLGDHDPQFVMFTADSISNAIRLVVNGGRLDGYTMADTNTITPSVAVGAPYGLLVYRTAMEFAASNPDSHAFRTRAVSERVGGWKAFMSHIEDVIYRLENGDDGPINMWQTWDTFVRGTEGLPVTAFQQALEFGGAQSDISYP